MHADPSSFALNAHPYHSTVQEYFHRVQAKRILNSHWSSVQELNVIDMILDYGIILGTFSTAEYRQGRSITLKLVGSAFEMSKKKCASATAKLMEQ